MNIVFFGASTYVIPVLDILYKKFCIALVITTEKPREDKKSPHTPVIDWCAVHKVSYSGVTDFRTKKAIAGLKTPVGVLASFGALIPKGILDLFPQGILNIHPSLLPKYRGPTPVQTAILNGDIETGVSIMRLDNEIDHGPILAQEKEIINSDDTTESLQLRLFTKGAKLLVKVLPDYLSGKLVPKPQNHTKAIYTKHLTRRSGYIDLSSLEISNSKLVIARKIRAYYPWPGVWTQLQINNSELRIKLLPGEKIQVEGKRSVSYKDFSNGYPKAKEILKNLL